MLGPEAENSQWAFKTTNSRNKRIFEISMKLLEMVTFDL